MQLVCKNIVNIKRKCEGTTASQCEQDPYWPSNLKSRSRGVTFDTYKYFADLYFSCMACCFTDDALTNMACNNSIVFFRSFSS